MRFGMVLISLLGLGIIGRFFYLQVIEGKTYQALASDQHGLEAALTPNRGSLFVRDRDTGELQPIVQDKEIWVVYAVPREVKPENASSTAQGLAELLQMPADEILQKITSTSTYIVLAKDVPLEVSDAIRSHTIEWRGIGTRKQLTRWYPEGGFGGQLLGFVGENDQREREGRYGIEAYYNDMLAGVAGKIVTERDASGRRLTIGDTHIEEARDGSSLVLTIDRAIQYEACKKIAEAVGRFGAQSGTIIVMNPKTGAVMAMCSAPDFSPADMRSITDIGVLNNPATYYVYEPGSIFKPLTLAAGLDAGKITADTVYVDSGAEEIDDFTIRNSDKLAHGRQTMTQVLEKSLNTGTIFVQRLLGRELFQTYVKKLGFGKKTEIDTRSEGVGNVAALERRGAIFSATASFGQGISTTPIQMMQAFTALANKGTMMKPYVVQEVLRPDGTSEKTKPQVVDDVFRPRTAQTMTAMLINVVENGHGKRAGVPGYYVAGKTGTAQIPDPRGGYLDDATIGSFIGYAPAQDPAFLMLVKIDKPTTVNFAESSAAPIFGEMAAFLLSYLRIPPTRPVATPPPAPVTPTPAPTPAAAAVSSTPAIAPKTNENP